jgi:lipopolysaccharide/colanic/teichoic acid biosynthesis glycosyltransferase
MSERDQTIDMDSEKGDCFAISEKQEVAAASFPSLCENQSRSFPGDLIDEGWRPRPYIPLDRSYIPLDRRPSLPLDGVQKEGGVYPLAKRLFDILGATIGLAGFILLFPLVALAIMLDSPGPLFYHQVRVGKGGRPLRICKLRTMVVDAEQQEDLWSNHDDPRVTRIGRWLRKTRLDEAPQCWNILKGEMSIVGPRPERLNVVEKLEKESPLYHLRHNVKPGLAGWAMVNRGHMCSREDAKVRLECDLYYVKHRSLWFDALIFFLAFWHLVTMKGV